MTFRNSLGEKSGCEAYGVILLHRWPDISDHGNFLSESENGSDWKEDPLNTKRTYHSDLKMEHVPFIIALQTTFDGLHVCKLTGHGLHVGAFPVPWACFEPHRLTTASQFTQQRVTFWGHK